MVLCEASGISCNNVWPVKTHLITIRVGNVPEQENKVKVFVLVQDTVQHVLRVSSVLLLATEAMISEHNGRQFGPCAVL
jgi:hypothetical protein